MTLDELLSEMIALQAKGHGNLNVITDGEDSILGAEFNDDGEPAVVLVVE
jgi:hypothetical protein